MTDRFYSFDLCATCTRVYEKLDLCVRGYITNSAIHVSIPDIMSIEN